MGRHGEATPERPTGSALASLRQLLDGGEPLGAGEAAALAAENRDREIRRLRVLAPTMVLLHLGHILFYGGSGSAAGDAVLESWRHHVVLVHAATLPVALALSAVAFLAPRSRAATLAFPLAAAAYLAHGAMASGVDQIAFANMDAFTGYALGIAVICAFPVPMGLAVYAVGLSVVAVALSAFQADVAIRTSGLLNALTVTTIGVVLGALLAGARRRDFLQRRTIARQRDELAALNADLERRVDEQVSEIVRRAEEISQLNAQLRSQIRARSAELSAALARLAEQRGEAGLLRPGTVLGDRFEIGDTLGRGAMGVVYAGRDRATGKAVAIKVIRSGSAVEVDAMRRFVGEASAVAAVSHPAVVSMIHVDLSPDGLLYQAQELVDGHSLAEFLGEGTWSDAGVARLGSVLFDALAAAHACGVVHRDVKPSNVMLTTADPGLRLLDFGLARLFDEASRRDDARATSETRSGLVVGTPAYMAPEQVLAREVTDRADVYSAAVLLFQLLTGRLAFETDGASRVMLSHVASAAPDLAALRPGTDAALAALVGSCLAKEPRERPSASQAAATLRAVAEAGAAPALHVMVARLTQSPGTSSAPRPGASLIARRMKGLSG